jgi:hypothetical protein
MKSSLFMVAAAFVLRVVVLACYWKSRVLGVWGINEAGSIARWLVVSHTFSSPFHQAAGPTAWLAPGYPFLCALVFAVFGVQSALSAAVMLLLNALFSSLTAVPVARLGSKYFNPQVGRLAGWAWAMSPYTALMTCLLWETSLSALVLTYAFWRTVGLDGQSPVAKWAGCGAIWAVAALVNPSLAAPFPFLAVYAGLRTPSGMRKVAAVVLSFAAVLSPWLARNQLALHQFFPIRSNGWAEVYFGNLGFDLHPLGQSMQYQRLGEVAYVRQLKQQVIGYVENHPGEFARKTLRRVTEFWTAPRQFWAFTWPLLVLCAGGLILTARQDSARSISFFAVLAFYPLVYYAAYVFSRYRHPIEPLIYVLSANAIVSAVSVVRPSRLGTKTRHVR